MIYLVTYADWDEHYISSAWSTKEAAAVEAARLNAEKKREDPFANSRVAGFCVEEFEIDKPEEDEE